MSAKKSVGFRLSEATIKDLASLSKVYHVSQADVIAIMANWLMNDADDEEESMEKMRAAFRTAAKI